MTFADSQWLWLLALAPAVLAAQLAGDGRAAARLGRLLGPRAAEHLEGRRPARRRWRRGLLLVALACLALGLARPQWGARDVVLRERGSDVVVALDVSASMRAEDVPPSRLARARAALGDLVGELRGGRIGLVLFAGAAFVQCPLTSDRTTAELFLRMADTEMISEQGTNIAAALAVGRQLLEGGGGSPADRRAVVLVTDGEDLEGGWQAEAELCREAGIMVVAVGIGSDEGGLIPAFDERGRPAGFLKDDEGAVVLSRLDAAALAELGRLTGGRALMLDDPTAPQRIVTALAGLSERELEERRVSARQERHHWAYAIALAALALREALGIGGRRRRGASPLAAEQAVSPLALPLALLLVLLSAAPSSAGLLRPRGAAEASAGLEHLRAGRAEQALASFQAARALAPEDPRLGLAAGAALSELGRHAEAARVFEAAADLSDRPADRAEALYDAGTALLRAGEAGAAADRLRRSLAIEPAREDALRNLEAALRLQQQQEQQPQEQEEGQPQDQQQEQQQDQQRQEQPQEQQRQGEQEDRQQGEPRQEPGPEQDEGAASAVGGKPDEPGMSRERALEVLRGLDRDEEQLRRSVQKRLRGGSGGSGRKW